MAGRQSDGCLGEKAANKGDEMCRNQETITVTVYVLCSNLYYLLLE